MRAGPLNSGGARLQKAWEVWEEGQEGTLSESLLPTTTAKEKGEELGGGDRCGLVLHTIL